MSISRLMQMGASGAGENVLYSIGTSAGGLDILSVTNSDFGAGDFTYEAWVYPTDLSNNFNAVVGHAFTSGGGLFYVKGNGAVELYEGGRILLAGAGTISTGDWYHIAAVRSSGTLTLYIDGTSVGSVAYTNSITDTNIYVGQNQSGNERFQGYIYRPHVIDVAKYTANFTPQFAYPTEANSLVLLEADESSFVDLLGNSITNDGAVPVPVPVPVDDLIVTGSDFDEGVRDDTTFPTTHTGTIDIPPDSLLAVFVVNRARTDGAAATASLTVDGNTCTEIHSVSFNDSTTRVYYLQNPPEGSVSFTSVDTGSASASVAVIGLTKPEVPSVSSTVFTPSNTDTLGLQTILSLSANADELIYCIAPSSNYVAVASSTNSPNSLFGPVEQAKTGNLLYNYIHCASDIFNATETYTVNYDVTTTYTYTDSSVYLVLSWA